MEEPINRSGRAHEVALTDWHLAEASRKLYRFYDLINGRFFDSQVPTPVLSFQKTRHLGHYVPARNEIGVRENINIDPEHLADPMAEVLSTLAHEMGHSWEYNHGKPGKGYYHNKELRDKLDGIGVPCDAWGGSTGIHDPFVSFLREHGVTGKKRLDVSEAKAVWPRRKSLWKWRCTCTTVWAPAQVHARCTSCGENFVRA